VYAASDCSTPDSPGSCPGCGGINEVKVDRKRCLDGSAGSENGFEDEGPCHCFASVIVRNCLTLHRFLSELVLDPVFRHSHANLGPVAIYLKARRCLADAGVLMLYGRYSFVSQRDGGKVDVGLACLL
jgi:hypothetical protein